MYPAETGARPWRPRARRGYVRAMTRWLAVPLTPIATAAFVLTLGHSIAFFDKYPLGK